MEPVRLKLKCLHKIRDSCYISCNHFAFFFLAILSSAGHAFFFVVVARMCVMFECRANNSRRPRGFFQQKKGVIFRGDN